MTSLSIEDITNIISEAIKASKSEEINKETFKMTVPTFNGRENEDYELYKFKLDNWINNTEIPDKKKSAMIINGLNEKALETIKMISTEKIYKDGGYKEILTALDERFAKDKSNHEFVKAISFMDIKQQPNESYKEFVNRYDRAKSECEKIKDITMSDKMHSYLIIHRSNMKEIEKKMILTHIHGIEENKYEEAKKYINNIMESIVAQSNEKEKQVNKQQWFSKYACKICGYRNHTTDECWWNEKNKDKCFKCFKEGHIAKNCQENKEEEQHTVYLQNERNGRNQNNEIQAILDTGCNDTCIGDI